MLFDANDLSDADELLQFLRQWLLQAFRKMLEK
jgi:hypothetical protein